MLKYQIQENSDDGIVIVCKDESGETVAKMSVHFCPTKACLLPDDEMEQVANTDAEAAVNVESTEFFADVLRINGIYVKEKYRRHGIGSFLAQKAQKYAILKKFPLVVSVFPMAKKGETIKKQDVRRLFWFFCKNGFQNRAIAFARARNMRMPDWFYEGARDFYYIPEDLREK